MLPTHDELNELEEMEQIVEFVQRLGPNPFTPKQRNHFLRPDSEEEARLRSKEKLSGPETCELMYHDGSLDMFGLVMTPPVKVLWKGLRRLVKARGIVVYWQELAVQRACGIGGRAYEEDRRAWESLCGECRR